MCLPLEYAYPMSENDYLVKFADLAISGDESQLVIRKYYLLSTNVLPKYQNKTCPPLEIALIEYTIKDGITDVYHQFVDGGDLPLGNAHMPVINADLIHKIPIKGFTAATDDYCLVVDTILKMIADSRPLKKDTDDRQYPLIVYSKREQIEQNKRALKWLSIMYEKERRKTDPNYHYELNVQVLNVADILFFVREEMGVFKSYGVGERQIDSSAFDIREDSNCDFHVSIDINDCSLGLSKRLAYKLSELLRPLFKFDVTDNKPKISESRRASLVSHNAVTDSASGGGGESVGRDADRNQQTESGRASNSLRLAAGLGRGRSRSRGHSSLVNMLTDSASGGGEDVVVGRDADDKQRERGLASIASLGIGRGHGSLVSTRVKRIEKL